MERAVVNSTSIYAWQGESECKNYSKSRRGGGIDKEKVGMRMNANTATKQQQSCAHLADT